MVTQQIEIGNKRTIEYLAECITRFNRGADTLVLRGFAGSISKAARVAQIVEDYLDRVKVKKTTFSQTELNGYTVPCLQIELHCPLYSQPWTQNPIKIFGNETILHQDFCSIDFLLYNTLIDALLEKVKKLQIHGTMDDTAFTCELKFTEADYSCHFMMSDTTKPQRAGETRHPRHKKRSLDDELLNVYYRAGLLIPPDWRHIAEEFAKSDDIIIGVDTNLLLNATLIEHFLHYSYLINPRKYIHTPNWMLIVIPKAVMYELEQASNSRDGDGRLSHIGRLGFRALGEILQLENCMDITGVSLSIFGTSSPGQDVRVEIRALREDLDRAKVVKMSRKLSNGDTIIRDEFTEFLRQINFHKGSAYFLTSDKTNAVLGRAEGLQSIYYKKPDKHLWNKPCSPQKLEKTLTNDKDNIRIPVPIGKLIYEFAVQFGDITLEWQEEKAKKALKISADSKGESIDPWLKKELTFPVKELSNLLTDFEGKFPLEQLKVINEDLSRVLFKNIL